MNCLACSAPLQSAGGPAFACPRCGSGFLFQNGSLIPSGGAGYPGQSQFAGTGEPVKKRSSAAPMFAGLAVAGVLVTGGMVGFLSARSRPAAGHQLLAPAAPSPIDPRPEAPLVAPFPAEQAPQDTAALTQKIQDLSARLSVAKTDAERAEIGAELKSTSEQLSRGLTQPTAP